MESPAEKMGRLVGALEACTDQVACLLKSSDYVGAVAILHRCQPVIDEISRIMAQPGMTALLEPAISSRISHWLTHQTAQLESLAANKLIAAEELNAVRVAQSRTQLFRAAYGRNDAALSQPTHYTGTA